MGNSLLSQVTARLETGSITQPGNTRGVLTIRTASTTLTVILTREDVRKWADVISSLADQLGAPRNVQPASLQDIIRLDGKSGPGSVGLS